MAERRHTRFTSESGEEIDPLYHLLTAVFEAKPPASAGEPFDVPPVTIRSLIASLKPTPPNSP